MVKMDEGDDRKIAVYLEPDVQAIITTLRPKNRSRFFNDAVRMQYRWQEQIIKMVDAAINAQMASFREEIRQLLLDCHKEQDSKLAEITALIMIEDKD